MKDSMGRIVGYINRSLIQDTLANKLLEKQKQVISADANQGYNLGHALGYQDALKDALKVLNELPDDPRATDDHNRKAWHHSQ